MKKILYLLPPSEGKNHACEFWEERLSFIFEKPLKIAKNATQKDLKCQWKRFEEAQKMNINILHSQTHTAISRYDWVMYKAIDYEGMSVKEKTYFEKHFLILSGMYGLLKPQDHIANYKLPIEAKGLVLFWKEKITQTLQSLEADIVVDMLPQSYKKMIDFSKLNAEIYEIEFVENMNWKPKKISHGVKKIKWEFIKNICKNWEIFSLQEKSIKKGKSFVFTLTL